MGDKFAPLSREQLDPPVVGDEARKVENAVAYENKESEAPEPTMEEKADELTESEQRSTIEVEEPLIHEEPMTADEEKADGVNENDEQTADKDHKYEHAVGSEPVAMDEAMTDKKSIDSPTFEVQTEVPQNEKPTDEEAMETEEIQPVQVLPSIVRDEPTPQVVEEMGPTESAIVNANKIQEDVPPQPKDDLVRTFFTTSSIPTLPASDMKTMSVRAYLEQTVVQTLLQGLSELSKERPDNPLEYLGKYLLAQSQNATT